MTSEAQSANGGGQISRLRRTLTLPLSRMKSRGGSFHAPRKASEDIKYEAKSDNEDNSEIKRPQKGNHLTQKRTPSGRKNDIRVSRINPHESQNVSKEECKDTTQQVEKVLLSINEDTGNSNASEEQEKKGKKKKHRYRRWPTQTLARVLDVTLLKRLGSARRNEHAATVLRTVTVHRHQGDTLGIYIKEMKRGNANTVMHSSDETNNTFSRSRVIISRLAPGSIAEKQGILKRGDEVLLVNNRDIGDMSIRKVAALMDFHHQLVLAVRSKHINANNNNDNSKVTVDSIPSDSIPPTSQNTTTLQHDCSFSAPTISVMGVSSLPSSLVPNKSSSSVSTGFTREEAIPSVYDNNFPSSLVVTVPTGTVEEEVPLMTAKHKLEMEYNEALSILFNAIESFETPIGTSGSNHERTPPSDNQFYPASYWSPLNEIISSNNSERSVATVAISGIENDDLSAASDSTTTSISTTPFFPSVSELPFSDDPDYDEVAASEFGEGGGEEVQVDGCARLFSPYRRSHSVSSSTSGSIHSSEAGNACPPAPFASGKRAKTFQHSNSQDFHNVSDGPLKHTSPNDFSPDVTKYSEVACSDCRSQESSPPSFFNQSQDSLHKKTVQGITVRQCQEWLDKGKEVSAELKNRIEGGSHRPENTLRDELYHPTVKGLTFAETSNRVEDTLLAKRDGGQTLSESSSTTGACSPNILSTPRPHDNKTSPESDKSPKEKSPKNFFKIPSNSERDNTAQEQSSRRSPPQTESQSAKKFWSKVASPPSLRRSKISRKITKLTKKKGGSSDWDSNDSSLEGSKGNSSGIIDRFNLELGEVQNHRLSCQFLPHNRRHDPSIKPLNLSEFKKYKPPSPNAESGKYSQIPIQGSLVITLYGARYIKKTVSEVYCISQVDDDVKHRIRTRMQPCRGSVAWNECYEAKLEEAYDLHITLYTWDSEGKHKVLAKSTLPVSYLLFGPQGVPVKLAVKLEPRGTLYIKLSMEDPSTLEGPKVFGADIQSILDREQSGLHIPLLVRDCIREVELRGMSVVGIYRLCGSAIAKRELRKKYEHDSTVVDLSQENYPDVNVITGILKDFLRELPQPLFPPELLEAVTVAMANSSGASSPRVASVSSPFEPTPPINFPKVFVKDEEMCTGSQSVILNLIEVEKKVTLPPAEKATLYALLNHLNKVSANQAQNKMTCQNLAVCFGPVLLGSINMTPSKGLDLTAAIGFKQHIQVLNFMVSNWPSKPVPLDSPDDVLFDPEKNNETISDEGSRRASKRISRVSLTRRISHIFMSNNGSNSSSLSGCVNFEGEPRNGVVGKPLFSNSRKSGSLTNILESNLDTSEGGFSVDGYFDQIDQDLFYQHDSTDDLEEPMEVPFRFGAHAKSRKHSI